MNALRVCINPAYLKDPYFNCMMVKLDASAKSDLKWEQGIEEATHAVAEGKKIIFDIDFGFDQQTKLTQMHFLTLTLAIDKFNMLYNQFKEHIRGICLLKTDLNFYKLIDWDLELVISLKKELHPLTFNTIEELLQKEHLKMRLNLFASELISNLLNLLLTQFPEHLESFILIDSPLKNRAHIYQLLASKHFQNFSFATCSLPIGDYQWNNTTFSRGFFLNKPMALIEVEKAFIGLLVTQGDDFLQKELFLQPFIARLSKLGVVVKVIEDEQLTQNWKGLETIVGFNALFSQSVQRQVSGFLATDGQFVDLGNESQVEQFFTQLAQKLNLKAATLKDLSTQKLSKHRPPSKQ